MAATGSALPGCYIPECIFEWKKTVKFSCGKRFRHALCDANFERISFWQNV